jgi:hypothetical protein
MEIQYLSVFGLVFIALGWLMQYLSMSKGNGGIVREFPALNAIGSALLIISSYQGGAMDIMAGNVLTFIGALLVFTAVRRK